MQFIETRSRLRPPCPVVDVHVHPLANFGSVPIKSPEQDSRLLLEAADRAGITYLCPFALGAPPHIDPTPEQFREANDWALAMREFDPERLLPFCYVSAAHPEKSVKEIDRCIGEHRMSGIKLWVAVRASDRRLDPIMGKAIEYNVPVLQHAWLKTTGNMVNESSPADVADLGCRHPKAKIIMAHLNGCGLRGIEDVKSVPNVHVDVGGGDPESHIADIAVDRLGVERVVYGSDAPIRHFSIVLGKVMGGRLTEKQQRMILYENALRLLPEWSAKSLRQSSDSMSPRRTR